MLRAAASCREPPSPLRASVVRTGALVIAAGPGFDSMRESTPAENDFPGPASRRMSRGYDAAMSNEPVDAAYARLRDHTNADIRFDEHLRSVQYVIDPEDGALIVPVMVAMLQTMDTVMFVPQCSLDALELGVTLVELDENGPGGAACDRWRIHHGEPPDVRWARVLLDAGRYAEHVIDGEALMRPNPLAAAEPALCRQVNGGRLDDLRTACERMTGVHIPEPRLVAVDPRGLDIRARFGVLRVPLPGGLVADDPASAEAAIERVLGGEVPDRRSDAGGYGPGPDDGDEAGDGADGEADDPREFGGLGIDPAWIGLGGAAGASGPGGPGAESPDESPGDADGDGSGDGSDDGSEHDRRGGPGDRPGDGPGDRPGDAPGASDETTRG
ncbi:MAG: hypothetical protein AB8G96_17100 [Phycisphaerales bacterium]